MARSLSAAEVRDAASAIAALYAGPKKLSRDDGWLSASDLSSIWGASENTARFKARQLVAEGKLEMEKGLLDGARGTFYRLKS